MILNNKIINLKERTFGGAGTCDAWYKNSEGYNWTLWPSDCITYWSVLILFSLCYWIDDHSNYIMWGGDDYIARPLMQHSIGKGGMRDRVIETIFFHSFFV